jgi:hypothetical protein
MRQPDSHDATLPPLASVATTGARGGLQLGKSGGSPSIRSAPSQRPAGGAGSEGTVELESPQALKTTQRRATAAVRLGAAAGRSRGVEITGVSHGILAEVSTTSEADGHPMTAGSSGVPDHFGARFSQPSAVTATVSSCRIPNSP